MSAEFAPSMPEVLGATVLALAVSLAVAAGAALVLQLVPPALGTLLRRVIRLVGSVPIVVMAAAVLTALLPSDTALSGMVLAVLLTATMVPVLTMRCDGIFQTVTRPLRDAAAALGAGALSIALTLVLPAALPAVAGAVLAAGAQGLGALLTLGVLQAATGTLSDTARLSPEGGTFGLGPLVLIAGTTTLAVSTLIGIYFEDFSEGSSWTRPVDVVIAWLSALPPLVYAVLLVPVVTAVRCTPPDAWSAALLFALLLGPQAALAVRGALAAVPASLREASRALGASRRQTLRHLVLPAAARPMVRHLTGAVTRATLEWLPFVAIGIAMTSPPALPAWMRTLDTRWMPLPGIPFHVPASAPSPALPDVAPVIGLLVGLTTVAAWLTPAPDSNRGRRP